MRVSVTRPGRSKRTGRAAVFVLVGVVCVVSLAVIGGAIAYIVANWPTSEADVATGSDEETPAGILGPGAGPGNFGALTESSGPKVGEPAPEIVGEDIDGKPFKLSDYRGKVVVLDFWGNW